MHPAIAFVLYLAVGSIVICMIPFLCVRVSVYIEETCPTRFCLRRKQRKMRKILIRRVLYPDEPESPFRAPPSDENITADIICQPYIYRDAYSTGLTGLSMLANLPLTLACGDRNPGDAVIMNEQLRVTCAGILQSQQQRTSQLLTLPSSTPSDTTLGVDDTEISMEENEDEEESLPPEYFNVASDDSKPKSPTSERCKEPPPPSYYECVTLNSK